jgi:protein ImuB
MALWFPHLPAQRILRQRLGRSWRSNSPREGTPRTDSHEQDHPPLVVSHRHNNTQRIVALDEKAAALGLKPGLGIADTRAMHPGIEVVEAEPEADRRLIEALADWCDRYTPLVAIDGDDGLFLDITGCAHLFGGERAMLDDLLAKLFHQGFAVSAGLASTPGAAWAGARFHLPPIAEGAEEDALAPLPLSALRLEPAVRAGLESVGLRTAGGVFGAPRAPLARRFGRDMLERLDQALGHVDEAVSPRLPVAPLSVERHLAEPVTDAGDIEELAAVLAAGLKTDLERRDEGARALELALFRVDGHVCRIAVGTSRPMRDPKLIRRLFREKLAAAAGMLDAGFGFDLIRLSVHAAASMESVQTDLAGRRSDEGEDLAVFADRVRARLGAQSVLRPVLLQSHVPERAIDLVAFAEAPHAPAIAPAGACTAPERPVRLFPRPEPVEVMAEIPEGPPAHFRWRRALHRVARSEGPERIAPEWWRDGGETPTRDYFRVEDADGRRYWLYRQGFYGTAGPAPRWFMHGIFA